MLRRWLTGVPRILPKMGHAVAPGRHSHFELKKLNLCDELEAAGAIGLSKNHPTYKPGEGVPRREPASASANRSSTASPPGGMCGKATSSRSTGGSRSTAGAATRP